MGVIVLFLWRVKQFYFSMDDIYISIRYAMRLAQGKGLTFNDNEYVEGFSNPLLVMLIAGYTFVGGGFPDFFCIVIGVLSSVLILLLAFLAFPAGRRLPMLFAISLLSTHPIFLRWTTGGLETSLHGMLLVLCCWFSGKFPLIPARQKALLGVAGVLLIYNRPEGLVQWAILSLLCLVQVLLAKEQKVSQRLSNIAFLSFPFCAWLPYLAFRYWYFGALTPNTITAKYSHVEQARDFWASVALGKHWLWFLRPWGGGEYGALLLLDFFALVPLALCTWMGHLAIVATCTLGLHLLIGGDFMDYRFLFFPTVVAFLGLGFVLEYLVRSLRRTQGKLLLVPAMVLGGLAIQGWYAIRTPLHPVFQAGMPWLRISHRAPEFLKSSLPGSHLHSLSTAAIGNPGYTHPHLTIVDTFGLTDRDIATQFCYSLGPIGNMSVPMDYLLRRGVTYISLEGRPLGKTSFSSDVFIVKLLWREFAFYTSIATEELEQLFAERDATWIRKPSNAWTSPATGETYIRCRVKTHDSLEETSQLESILEQRQVFLIDPARQVHLLPVRGELGPWASMPEEFFRFVYGKPKRVTELPDGSKVLHYAGPWYTGDISVK